MTRDQERTIDMIRNSSDAATIVSRLFLQGMDPLSYLAVCPQYVLTALDILGYGRRDQIRAFEAIKQAHVRGPTCEILPEDSAAEDLWLLLARFSGEEPTDELKPMNRIQSSVDQIIAFTSYLNRLTSALTSHQQWLVLRDLISIFRKDALGLAYTSIYIADSGPVSVVPLFSTDLGFYAGYRRGFNIVGVDKKTPDSHTQYFATDGSIELASVRFPFSLDILVTPYFGFRFVPKEEVKP